MSRRAAALALAAAAAVVLWGCHTTEKVAVVSVAWEVVNAALNLVMIAVVGVLAFLAYRVLKTISVRLSNLDELAKRTRVILEQNGELTLRAQVLIEENEALSARYRAAATDAERAKMLFLEAAAGRRADAPAGGPDGAPPSDAAAAGGAPCG